jgi:hypothetical protein
MKLYDTDYVLINTKTNKPIEGFDIVYPLEEVRWFLYEGIYTEEEINKILAKLQSKGKCKIENDWSFVSMTKLPIEIQKKYIETLKQTEW